MAVMGALVAGVAHEVRNPLFGMSAMLDAYDEELRAEHLGEFSDRIREQVTRLTHLMTELLEFGSQLQSAVAGTPAAAWGAINYTDSIVSGSVRKTKVWPQFDALRRDAEVGIAAPRASAVAPSQNAEVGIAQKYFCPLPSALCLPPSVLSSRASPCPTVKRR